MQVRCRPAISCSWTFLPARALVRVCGYLDVTWDYDGKDAELHCGRQDEFSAHFMDSGSDDLVLCGFGAKRGLDPFQHVRWALQQVRPHASMQSVLEPKLDAVPKLVASTVPSQSRPHSPYPLLLRTVVPFGAAWCAARACVRLSVCHVEVSCHDESVGMCR